MLAPSLECKLFSVLKQAEKTNQADAYTQQVNLLCQSYTIHEKLFYSWQINNPTSNKFQEKSLVYFFKNVEEGLLQKKIECVNHRIVDNSTWDTAKCNKWFKDNLKVNDKPNTFGSYFQINDSQFLFHIAVDNSNLHIGFVKYKTSKKNYIILPMEKDDHNVILKEYRCRLPYKVKLSERDWGYTWRSIDCGNFTNLENEHVLSLMRDFENSEIFNEYLVPLLGLQLMEERQLFEDIAQCSSGHLCHICRNISLGYAWRQSMQKAVTLPCGGINFACPYGKSWGYISSGEITVNEQLKFASQYIEEDILNLNFIDIVYPFIEGKDNSEELRLSLRSLENLEEDIKVWVVGDKPDWLNTETVNYIAMDKIPRAFDMDLKIHTLVNSDKVGKHIMLMNDDLYLIKPVSLKYLAIPRYVADYTDNIETCEPSTHWSTIKLNDFLVLSEDANEQRDYSLHWPYVFEKEKYLQLFEQYDLLNRENTWENLYYNCYAEKKMPFNGELLRVNFKYHRPAKTTHNRYTEHLDKKINLNDIPKNVLILNNNSKTFSRVKSALLELFPNPSQYEIDSYHHLDRSQQKNSYSKGEEVFYPPWDKPSPTEIKNSDNKAKTLRWKCFYDSYFESLRNNTETLSGNNSKLVNTRTIRKVMQSIVDNSSEKLLFSDLGCGDLNWIKEVDFKQHAYCGLDIVAEIINENILDYSDTTVNFKVADVVSSPLQKSDYILCKDLFSYLPAHDCLKLINNIILSGSTYLIASMPYTGKKSAGSVLARVAKLGERKEKNLFDLPFAFPEALGIYKEENHEQYYGLWEIKNLNFFDSQYEVIDTLGIGKNGAVFLAKGDSSSEPQKLLKYININKKNSGYIKNEIEMLKVMNHYEQGIKFLFHTIKNTSAYLYFEYHNTIGLDVYITRNGDFDDLTIFEMLNDLLKQLEFMQTNNILHLEIKPENIVYNGKTFYLVDWEGAIMAKTAETISFAQNQFYTPPEFFDGTRTFESEIYTLGCVLYYVASRRNISEMYGLKSSSSEQKMKAHKFGEPVYNQYITSKVKKIISLMVKKTPSERATVKELKSLVELYLSEV